MYELCVKTGLGFKKDVYEMIPLIRSAGFDGFFTSYKPGETKMIADAADKAGLLYQSVHAPFGSVHEMWLPGDQGDHVRDGLIACLNECRDAGVERVVMHAIIGMDRHEPTELGLIRFSRVVKRAEMIGINIAFENTEGEEFLAALMDRFRSGYVGFCWDTGHEQCYNYGNDMTAKYGDRLVCTHLNDNLGMTDVDDMTWLDDSHLMPFDGITDWQSVADRLREHGYKGELTFELTRNSKPGKNTHDIYTHLDEFALLSLAYEKAVKFRDLINKNV